MHVEAKGPDSPNGIPCPNPGSLGQPYCDFATAVEDFAGAGIPVFPVSLAEKKPLVRKPERITVGAAHRLAEKHSNANVAFWCGEPSGLTVVDIDSTDLGLLHWARDTFGYTDVQVRTPSGHYHLYYRNNGEPLAVRGFGKRPVDLLGEKIMCVAPPSTLKGGRYHFIQGDHTDIPNVPTVRREALSLIQTRTKVGSGLASAANGGPIAKDGERNNHLFAFALRAARRFDDHAEYIDAVLTENARCDPPMTENEALRAALKPWEYKQNDGLYALGRQRIPIFTDIVAPLLDAGHSDALLLHTLLASKHFSKGKEFAISPKAMVEHQVIGSWGYTRLIRARGRLLELGILECVHFGGAGKGDPSIFRFADGAIN